MSLDTTLPLASNSTSTNPPHPPPSAPRQIPINLFTRSSTHAIPQSTYLIPSTWRRFQLSELINKVLSLPQAVPFDFLVEGEVLRGSLDNWVNRNRGRDEEGTVDVEYVRGLIPPEEVGRVEMDDWVSGLSLGRLGYILVSSYLSHVQVLPMSLGATSRYSPSSSGLYTLPLPISLGATCCTWLSPPSTTENILLAAGGVDRAVHVFSISSLEPDTAASEAGRGREMYTLLGHTGPISSLASSSSGRELVSSSWDGNLNLYLIPNEEETEHQLVADPVSYLPGQKKRRKMNEVRPPIEGLTDGESSGEGGWRRAPDGIMRGHKERVGSVVWDKEQSGRVWSAGWDGSVRGWDVETGAGAVVRQGPMDKSALCIDQFRANGTLATGSMDRTICLWDTREATSLISLTLPTISPVPSLKCHPTSAFTLASAIYAGAIQIWDVRSPKNPLFSVSKAPKAGAGEARRVTKNGKVLGERLLALDWDGEVIVAGGEDGEVGIWRGRGE